MSVQPSRRAVLQTAGVGLVAGLLAACTSSDGEPTTPSTPTADDLARVAAARRERDLAARAQATAQAYPTLAPAAVAAAAHAAHADALSETLAPSAQPSASASDGAAGVPPRKQAAARRLAAAQRKAAQAHRKALAEPSITGGLARLLASVAGSDEGLAVAVSEAGTS